MKRNRIWRAAALLATVIFSGPLAAADANGTKVIVALGDSLTAGFGLPGQAAFPAQLERALRAKGHRVRVVNGGNSGDTAAEGLARFDWTTPPEADAMIVELGANDGLRGLAPAAMQAALDTIITQAKQRGLAVLLTGMRAPGNWGEAYRSEFAAVYPALAKRHAVPLYPFFLDGVAGDAALNQPDRLHPTESGIARIVARILPAVEPLLAPSETRP